MNKRIGTPFYVCFDPFVIIYRRFAEDDELHQISIASSLGQTSDAAFFSGQVFRILSLKDLYRTFIRFSNGTSGVEP